MKAPTSPNIALNGRTGTSQALGTEGRFRGAESPDTFNRLSGRATRTFVLKSLNVVNTETL
ncbi:hypothetical protein QOZ95_004253 [Paenibacillus brasilensis]|uniref:Uncharacterized protein n=1 Tax=Paenibacillus brasilensis TaxID=128574 RepID=A0ABU0L451_9BACL|nr:hypothetical protein [Paenibacillus brasilensis]